MQVSVSEARTAQCSPPPPEPANRWFFLPKAIGRVARGLASGNPWTGLGLPRAEPDGRHAPYTAAELRLLAGALAAAPADVAFAFRVALYSGMRLSEVATIDAVVLEGPMP